MFLELYVWWKISQRLQSSILGEKCTIKHNVVKSQRGKAEKDKVKVIDKENMIILGPKVRKSEIYAL